MFTCIIDHVVLFLLTDAPKGIKAENLSLIQRYQFGLKSMSGINGPSTNIRPNSEPKYSINRKRIPPTGFRIRSIFGHGEASYSQQS